MPTDLGPLLRRLVLASSPVLTAGAACDSAGTPYCGTGPPPRGAPFDFTVVVLDDPSSPLGKYVLAPTVSVQADGGPDDFGRLERLEVWAALREAHDACAANHDQCGPFCALAMTARAKEVHSCVVVGGSAERPIVRVTGEGIPPACGRRPAGFQLRPPHGPTTTGSFLDACAALEAASVHAFRRLAGELRALGAPPHLRGAALAAARDEIRHTHLVHALAVRHGMGNRHIEPPAQTTSRPRPLAVVACENAEEGCVRETFGALLAHLQARAAGDPAVRAVMAEIAVDETRHANLAWDIHRWAWTRLRPPERARLLGDRAAAMAELRAECARPLAANDAAAALGLPEPALATALFDELAATLWQVA